MTLLEKAEDLDKTMQHLIYIALDWGNTTERNIMHNS